MAPRATTSGRTACCCRESRRVLADHSAQTTSAPPGHTPRSLLLFKLAISYEQSYCSRVLTAPRSCQLLGETERPWSTQACQTGLEESISPQFGPVERGCPVRAC